MRYYAEWLKYLDWCVVDLKTEKIVVSGVSQSTAKFVTLTLNLREPEKEKKDAD